METAVSGAQYLKSCEKAVVSLRKGLHNPRHCWGKADQLDLEGKFCLCHPSMFSLSRAAPALGTAPPTQIQRLPHKSTSVTWCDPHQVQDTCDHTIRKQAFPYTAGIHSGGPALSVLSTQVNHIRQTDRCTHAYTNTAGTQPSYQGQSTHPPHHITLNM